MNWQEYKERKEAQDFFRQNNDLFLSPQEWVKVIGAGLLGALLLGVVLAALTIGTRWSFSILYIVIGLAIANIVTSVSGVHSKQMGIASGILTLISFIVCHISMTVLVFGFSSSLLIPMIISAFQSLFTSGILELIFVVMGIFSAYQQAS